MTNIGQILANKNKLIGLGMSLTVTLIIDHTDKKRFCFEKLEVRVDTQLVSWSTQTHIVRGISILTQPI